MGAQQSIDDTRALLGQLVDPYSVLEPSASETPATPRETPPTTPVQPVSASASASASTSHISLMIDDTLDEIELNPKPTASSSSSSSITAPSKPSHTRTISTDPIFEDPVDQIMSRIAPPSLVTMLSSPENSASELPITNPRASA